MSILSAQNIAAGYNKVEIISDISLNVETGSKVALIGSNGAGKSTLVKAINGLIPISAGHLLWDTVPVQTVKAAMRTRAGIATVPEGRHLFPECSVLENLTAAAIFSKAKEKREESLENIMKLFPRLGERSAQRVGTLSGGEQQMVAIGRALMTQPQLLILDEPSIGLSPRIVGEIFEVLGELSKTGLSLLLVEQNVELSLRFVDYAYVLQQGKITLSGPANDLLDDKKVRAAYLGE
ncbi:ABC transporter ATP-binding protein [Kordiimonas pumila]|uniref:ABC transporter ATP-binding protein n=1 Tax=Kordiimonas pumila TaxID=2161677 RepID=A0ABV7D4T5_9PROT|nr:ABC transporter ATP-binding protein [Kordiimonas pumila]